MATRYLRQVFRVRRLLLLLIAFSLVGGGTVQLARAAQCPSVSMMPSVPSDCGTMTSMTVARVKEMRPGKSGKPDCIKHLCCVATIGEPAEIVGVNAATEFGAVEYWLTAFGIAGLTRQPEFIPLRTS